MGAPFEQLDDRGQLAIAGCPPPFLQPLENLAPANFLGSQLTPGGVMRPVGHGVFRRETGHL